METLAKLQAAANIIWGSSWRVPQRILTAICLLLLCMYLIYGKHPQIICNTFATIPAALFTYSLLLKTPPEPHAQNAILLYWSAHGVLICFDNTFGDLFGYFLAKFVLLCTLLICAVQKSALATELRSSANTLLYGPDSEKFTNESTTASLITMRSTLASFPFCESTMSTALSRSSLETPMKTITKSAAHSTTKTIYDLLNEDLKAGDHRRHIMDGDSIISAATADASTCIEQSKFEPSSVLNEQGDQAVQLNHTSKKYFGTIDELPTTNGDYLITNPPDKVTFKHPFKDSVTIAITNTHTKPVMWSLKTNALQRLAAQPTCGVLPSYATVHLKIGLLGIPPNNTFGMDRMAVDYCVVEEGIAVFDRALMRRKGTNHRRKNISVAYTQ